MSDFAIDIFVLARQKPLHKLSQQSITKAVRDALRNYGFDDIEVSCSATLSEGRIWSGKCRINSVEVGYQLISGPIDPA
jgi:hypothetical protein